jgi:hypothetical protein
MSTKEGLLGKIRKLESDIHQGQKQLREYENFMQELEVQAHQYGSRHDLTDNEDYIEALRLCRRTREGNSQRANYQLRSLQAELAESQARYRREFG